MILRPEETRIVVVSVMASGGVKQGQKNAAKGAPAPGGGPAAPGAAVPLASPLMGGLSKKKKPFLGMPAPLGYVPGLGRG